MKISHSWSGTFFSKIINQIENQYARANKTLCAVGFPVRIHVPSSSLLFIGIQRKSAMVSL